MKRLISLAMMMLPVMAMAQIPQFAKLSEKYSNIEGITSMTINKQMMAMFAGDNDDFDFIDELQILLCFHVPFETPPHMYKSKHKD